MPVCSATFCAHPAAHSRQSVLRWQVFFCKCCAFARRTQFNCWCWQFVFFLFHFVSLSLGWCGHSLYNGQLSPQFPVVPYMKQVSSNTSMGIFPFFKSEHKRPIVSSSILSLFGKFLIISRCSKLFLLLRKLFFGIVIPR